MNRGLGTAAALAVALMALQGSLAHAQFGYYPGGYGGYSWGGWGGGIGGATVGGDMARGLGVFAAGAGQYNVQTAQARSINTDTVMRWNQYLYLSQQEANRREHERMAERQLGTTKARDEISKRLRDNPQPRDIYTGDALNVAYDEINDPRIYTKTLQAAKAKIGGEVIRDVPFQYAAGAISTSVHDLTQNGPPPILQTPAFEPERTELKEVAASIRKQVHEGQNPDPAALEKARTLIAALRTKLESKVKPTTPGFNDGEKYLKAAYGLTRMLEGPSMNVILAGVEKRPDATFADLLHFMNAFNLRFGRADSPRQRQVYDMLYPMLVNARNEVAPALAAVASAPTADAGKHTGEFFSGMDYKDLESKKTPPPPPAPKP